MVFQGKNVEANKDITQPYFGLVSLSIVGDTT